MFLSSRFRFRGSSLERPAVWPMRLLFGLDGLSFALLLPRIPDLKSALDLSEAELGVALLGIPAGSLIGLLVAPVAVRRLGLGTASRIESAPGRAAG